MGRSTRLTAHPIRAILLLTGPSPRGNARRKARVAGSRFFMDPICFSRLGFGRGVVIGGVRDRPRLAQPLMLRRQARVHSMRYRHDP